MYVPTKKKKKREILNFLMKDYHGPGRVHAAGCGMAPIEELQNRNTKQQQKISEIKIKKPNETIDM